MALTPIDEIHALQIQAGTLGRTAGHKFEGLLADKINAQKYPMTIRRPQGRHVFQGNPANLLVRYVASQLNITKLNQASAISTGALATSEAGKTWLSVNGATLSRCKSDLILTLRPAALPSVTVGISMKQCNNTKPTNAQLYFSTARGFVSLLRGNGIPVSDEALTSLRRFCGDSGFRPSDNAHVLKVRAADPRRFFWEEIGAIGLEEWQALLSANQAQITRLLLQKAYMDDPFTPEFVLHKTRRAQSWDTTEVAIYSIDELVELSRAYQGLTTKRYSVSKGSYKDAPGVEHLAPRFGIVQMQRGGQKQHPEQLQFNLAAGYFYKI